MEISFTRYRLYRECPWKYKLFFVEGRRIAPTPASALGLSLHRALERFHRGGDGSLESLLEALDDEWLPSAFSGEKDPESWRKKAARILARYHESEEQRRSAILGVEREFVFPLGRHTVRGMIDRIDRLPDGKVQLIDYKTQLAFGPADEPPAQPLGENAQLRFYALGARESLALAPDLIAVHYLAAGRVESAPYDASGEEALKADIAGVADAIEAGKWAPETSFCPRCDFRNSCAYSVARKA